jgi:hypothetical protein
MDVNLQKRPSYEGFRVSLEIAGKFQRVNAIRFRPETGLDVYQAKINESFG